MTESDQWANSVKMCVVPDHLRLTLSALHHQTSKEENVCNFGFVLPSTWFHVSKSIIKQKFYLIEIGNTILYFDPFSFEVIEGSGWGKLVNILILICFCKQTVCLLISKTTFRYNIPIFVWKLKLKHFIGPLFCATKAVPQQYSFNKLLASDNFHKIDLKKIVDKQRTGYPTCQAQTEHYMQPKFS